MKVIFCWYAGPTPANSGERDTILASVKTEGTSGLEIAAAAFQLGGAVIAIYGVWKTWHSFATAGDRFFAPVTAAFGAIGQTIARLARRLFRRRRDVVVGVGTAGGIGVAGKARAVVTFGPIPNVGDPNFAAEVERRINETHKMAQDARHEVVDEREARKKADDDLRMTFGERMDRLEGMTRQVAIGGLRWEALGVALVIVGAVLGFFAR